MSDKVTRTAREVVTGLGWCDFTVYDDGKVKVKSPFWEHIFFKPTKNIHGKPMRNPGEFWLNETHMLHPPGVPLTQALDNL